MAELGKKLGKLSLAILENYVEKALGKKFVEEVYAPTGISLAMEAALEKSEQRFTSEFPETDFAKRMFGGVSEKALGSIVDAIDEFYGHPTGAKFPNALHQILSESFPDADRKLISSAVQFYIDILTEEFALADEKFRENIRALSDLRSVTILRRVEMLLSQREAVKVENTIFRSLHQLPQPPADFTGRDELITQLLEDFNTHKGATITGRSIHGLTGMGGIGKTALGLVVAHQVAKEYPDAQIFLDLKGTTEPISAMDSMRHVILSFEPTADLRTLDEANMAAAYQTVLDGKQVLLFLDNARSAEQISPLQPPETCAMLVTSRWVFPVPGLQMRRVDLMSEKYAQEFLIKLCPRIGDQAGELAKACAYLPLALRIAGSFLQVNDHWNIQKYITRLNDHKERLATLHLSHEEGELKTEPDLLATFELSYGQLVGEDQQRWRTLGVFPASFDAVAAGALWDSGEEETLKLLGLLLRYSLLDYDGTSSRYSLHDLLADFARSKMGKDEEREVRLKHASYFKDVLGAANGLYLRGGENIVVGLRLIDLEWENIRAGQAWVTQNSVSRSCLELCNEYPNVGYMILSLRLTPRGRIAWLEKGLDAAKKLGNKKHAGSHLGNLGNAYVSFGDARKAIEIYEQELAIAREIGDRWNEGGALGSLGIGYAYLGEAHKAIEYYEQQLLVVREINDRRGEGNTLNNMGIAYADLGQLHKAIGFYEQSLSIGREIGDRRIEGNAFGNLGIVYSDLGETRKAIESCEAQLVIVREIGDRRGEGNALGSLGTAYAALGETRKAIGLYKGQLVIAREIEDRHAEGTVLGNLGVAHENLGENRKAIEFYEQALKIAREIGDRRGEGNALFNMGLAFDGLEEKERAVELVQQALAIYEAIESPYAKDARDQLKKWGVLPGEAEADMSSSMSS